MSFPLRTALAGILTARPMARTAPATPARSPRRALAVACCALLSLAGGAQAESPLASEIPESPGAHATPEAPATPEAEHLAAHQAALARWKRSFDAFEAADRASLPAADGVLFVGSSTVRMWSSLARDFSEWPVIINRGFGGSTMAECRLLARELVLRYRPRHVLLYAGDNDLAQGRSPLQVMQDFAAFAATVRAALPQTRISFISIKPSPARARLLERAQRANAMVQAWLRTQSNVDYIDVFTPMLDAAGQPRAELFLADRLHLNAEGYQLWHDVITAQLQPGAAGGPPVAAEAPVSIEPTEPTEPANAPPVASVR